MLGRGARRRATGLDATRRKVVANSCGNCDWSGDQRGDAARTEKVIWAAGPLFGSLSGEVGSLRLGWRRVASLLLLRKLKCW